MSEFLSSDVYNPNFTPDVEQLYALMTTNPVDQDALLEEQRDSFRQLPTENAYAGVLLNPRACEADQAHTDIDGVIEDLRNRLDDVLQNEQPTVVEEWRNEFPEIIADLERAKEVVNQYKEHTDRLVSNFPTISSIVQSEISNQLGKLGGNPCAGFGDIMGSVLQQGQDIIGDIIAAVADVKNNVQGVLDLIQNAVSELMANIAKAETRITDEIDKIAQSMLNMQKMNMAQMLKYQLKDPCMGAILGGLMTAAASQITES